jgi:cbb3-type cytochrome oxidase subunit 3
MQPDSLPLRDIHQPLAPPWWPPAPGWWLLAAMFLMLIAVTWWFAERRRRRQQAIAALFDAALQQADSPAAQVAAMSELLRRAARRHDGEADRYTGDAWLQFLDAGLKQPAFAHGVGRLLLEGAFRPDVDPDAVATLRPLARQRYLSWMTAKR